MCDEPDGGLRLRPQSARPYPGYALRYPIYARSLASFTRQLERLGSHALPHTKTAATIPTIMIAATIAHKPSALTLKPHK